MQSRAADHHLCHFMMGTTSQINARQINILDSQPDQWLDNKVQISIASSKTFYTRKISRSLINYRYQPQFKTIDKTIQGWYTAFTDCSNYVPLSIVKGIVWKAIFFIPFNIYLIYIWLGTQFSA